MQDDRSGLDTTRRWQEFNERYYAGELTVSDWENWYTDRLCAVLTHVQTNSPFYRTRLAGIDPTEFTLDDLTTLPTTTKADLRQAQHGILSQPISQAAIYYETTGTTGPTTPCPRSPLEITTSNAHVRESWRRMFAQRYGEDKPFVGLMGPAELYAFCDTFDDVAQDLGVGHVKIWPESPRVGFLKALRLLHELRVNVVVCAPALCLNLAKAALHHGYDLHRDFAIDQFLVLGEVCTPAFRDNVRSIWGADVLPTLYGSQEALAIATGCPEGNLHLSRTNYIVELLDPETGQSKTDSDRGELCLTMLAPGSKPLIRYRTGDLVQLSRHRCSCGHPGEEIEVIGRCDDGVPLGTGRHSPSELETAILQGVTGCLGYQVVVDDRSGTEDIAVRLDLLPEISGDPTAVQRGVSQRLGKLCGRDVDVSVVAELDPITNTGAFVSWKAARIEDRRNLDDPITANARRAASAHAVTP